MVDSITVVISAVKFGYNRYGARGAVASAVAVGASTVIIKKVVPRYTSVEEERVDEIYERITEDNELAEILGEEFNQRFGDYLEDDSDESSS